MSRAKITSITLALLFGVVAIFFLSRRFDPLPAAAARALISPDQFELLSLKPRFEALATQNVEAPQLFHNHGILGRTTITDAAVRQKLVDALKRGARESDGSVAACFNPRHAIRVTQAAQTTDFIICFECKQVSVRNAGEEIARFLTSPFPQPTFDDVLKAAGIPLSSK